jgi:hypothetical protein
VTNSGTDVANFARLIDSIEPWLDQVVIIGGWAHRLYRFHPSARAVEYPPLTTFDADVALPSRLDTKEQDIRERLVANGFREEFLGDHQPPATHYRLGDAKSGFYAEFLTPLIGSQYDRKGTAKATGRVGGVTSQKLRHLDLLLDMPWHVELDESKGFPLAPPKRLRFRIRPATWHRNYSFTRIDHKKNAPRTSCTCMTRWKSLAEGFKT